ncbi:MAG: glycerophosphoryl diester phosphodiesterase [Blastocatellia bacterium]|nr:glycerophosphoryl diester phosphodiesterase [Blastocatellia bacterium]
MAAFKRALDAGADGIEFDVRLSRDGVPVVIHDPNLRRVAGRKEMVSLVSVADLAECDVGSWFNHRFPALAQEAYAAERVPTLETFFDFIQGHHGTFYLEMKPDRNGASHLALAVGQLIQQRQFQDRIVVLSFDLAAIKAVKESCPEIRTGALFQPRLFRAGSVIRRGAMIRSARSSSADEIALHNLLATPRLIEQAKRAALKVVVWTVDDPRWLETARRLGLKAIITNNPHEMIARRANASIL